VGYLRVRRVFDHEMANKRTLEGKLARLFFSLPYNGMSHNNPAHFMNILALAA